jgi:exosortase A
MTAASFAAPTLRPVWRPVRTALPVLAVALLCFGFLFEDEVRAAVRVWIDSRTYNHCFLILPIAAWLAWDRRYAARAVGIVPTPWPALVVLPLGLAWFAADRLGVMEGRQLAVIFMVQALIVAVLGWKLARAYAAAITYLVFLVPFGAFTTHALQVVTTHFVDLGLGFLAIPHAVTEFTIEVPTGTFYIAEACAGLRFLIAAIAFGALYAALVYRTFWRRAALMAASVIIPIIANGLRALGTVVLSEILGSAQAAIADHIVYGWGFFSVVILLMIVAGLPFREDLGPRRTAPVPAPPAPPQPAPAWAAGALVVVFAAAGPAAAGWLDRSGSPYPLSLPGFAVTADCLTMGDPASSPVQHFACGGRKLSAGVRALPPGSSPADLRDAVQDATGERGLEDVVVGQIKVPGTAAPFWRLVEPEDPARLVATVAFVDGAPDPGGLAGRLRLAWDSVTGKGGPVVVVVVRLEPGGLDGPDARAVAVGRMRGFIAAQSLLLEAAAEAGKPEEAARVLDGRTSSATRSK